MPARRRRQVACLRCARRIVAGKQQVCEDGEGEQPQLHTAAARRPQFGRSADIWTGSSAKCTYCQGLKKGCQAATGTLRATIKTLMEESARQPRSKASQVLDTLLLSYFQVAASADLLLQRQFDEACLVVSKALQKEKEKRPCRPRSLPSLMPARTKEDREAEKMELLRRQTNALESMAQDLSVIREGLVPEPDKNSCPLSTNLLAEVTKIAEAYTTVHQEALVANATSESDIKSEGGSHQSASGSQPPVAN
ncbi:hypothetical protein PG993_008982 [Apiospora rasikravindrae]|uniref:Uncharacterized protein n=1 Tax=Apiospora rasikravindrae TaxID=990691 RepID=A0ABR1SI48_9PEZI